jgi:hypothetical protein
MDRANNKIDVSVKAQLRRGGGGGGKEEKRKREKKEGKKGNLEKPELESIR